jgi:hypothetical protein
MLRDPFQEREEYQQERLTAAQFESLDEVKRDPW